MKSAKQAHSAGIKKPNGDWHVSNTSLGMGDYYGTGIKQKIGKVRDSYTPMARPASKKQLKIPPKTLA